METTNVQQKQLSKEPFTALKVTTETNPIFTPSSFVDAVCLYIAIKREDITVIGTNHVKLLSIKNPFTNDVLRTAFAVEDVGGWIWCSIGEKDIYVSSFEAFKYEETSTYQIYFKKQHNTAVLGTCTLKEGEVQVISLEKKKQGEETTPIPNEICPCDLHTAAAFVQTLQL